MYYKRKFWNFGFLLLFYAVPNKIFHIVAKKQKFFVLHNLFNIIIEFQVSLWYSHEEEKETSPTDILVRRM